MAVSALSGMWDIKTKRQVYMPPQGVDPERWLTTVSTSTQDAFFRLAKTARVMEIIVEHGIAQGLTAP